MNFPVLWEEMFIHFGRKKSKWQYIFWPMLVPLVFFFFFPFLSPLHLVFFVLLSQISQCLKDLKLTNPISFQDKDYQNNFCFLFNCVINGNIISLSPCHFKHLLEISSECLPSFHAFLLLPSFLNIYFLLKVTVPLFVIFWTKTDHRSTVMM